MSAQETETPTIEAAILALHSRDADMARYQNSVGFNGRDTSFGNSLGFQIKAGKKLSPRQLAAAHRMLRTYRVQLLRDHGIDYDAIPAPDAPKVEEENVTGSAKLADDGFVVVKFTGYPGALLESVKRVPGARYDGTRLEWSFALTPQTQPYIDALHPAIGVGADVKAAMGELARKEAASVEASVAVEADIDLPWSGDLYGFQRAGVAYALEHGRTLIADEMGLGKTVQALATIEATGSYPLLVVVPAVVKLNWQREANRWVPARTVEVVQGRKPYPVEADITIINYDLLSAWKEPLTKAGYKAVVFDESHYVKNGTAARTKAAKAIAHTIPLRLLLTGTPVLNRPVELVSQLDVLGRLDDFGGFWPFVTRYCNARRSQWGWDMTGAAHLDELHAKLQATCYVRRTKDQVLGDLPPKQRVSLPIAFDRTRYDKIADDLKVWLKERILADEAFTRRIEELMSQGGFAADAKAGDLRADAEAARMAREKERRMGRAALLVKIEALKQAVGEGKVDPICDWIADFLETGKKLVVFGNHRKVVDGIAARFGAVKITGDTSMEARQAAVDAFQNDDATRLLVGNIQAAGVGITLTAASDVAFVELPWRPGDLTQAEDRCHRIGQEDSVTCWYLLGAGTIEEEIAKMLDTKRAVVDQATDGKRGIAPQDSLVDALAEALEKEARDGA